MAWAVLADGIIDRKWRDLARGRSISGWKFKDSALVPGIGWRRLKGGSNDGVVVLRMCVCVFSREERKVMLWKAFGKIC